MIEDFYREIFFVDRTRVPDGTGGFEYVYTIAQPFKGSVVRSSSQEQLVAGVRGIVEDQYNLTTKKNIAVSVGDVLMYVNEDNKRVYLRVISNPSYTPKQSVSKDWKGFIASEFKPDLRVVN